MNPRRMYETTFIVNSALEDTTIDGIINTTAEFIKNNGGTIDTLDKWGRRRLAYPIQKKHNGYYVYVLFESPASMLPQFARYFQLEENVIRHLTVTMSPQALEFRRNFLTNRTERMIEPGTVPAPKVVADAPAAKIIPEVITPELAEEIEVEL